MECILFASIKRYIFIRIFTIQSPRLATILHICEGLNMELTEFFADPLFEEVEYEED